MQGLVAEDRCNQIPHTENGLFLTMWDKQSETIRYHIWFGAPLSRDVQLRLTRAFAQFLAWADHIGLRVANSRQGRTRRTRKSKKRAGP
jgi:hypothetical protein